MQTLVEMIPSVITNKNLTHHWREEALATVYYRVRGAIEFGQLLSSSFLLHFTSPKDCLALRHGL